MTRLTSRSDDRSPPLIALISGWAAADPKIRRVWLAASPADRSDSIALTIEPEPECDSEETLPVWLANAQRWAQELAGKIGQPVRMEWYDPDAEGSRTALGPEPALIYERNGAPPPPR